MQHPLDRLSLLRWHPSIIGSIDRWNRFARQCGLCTWPDGLGVLSTRQAGSGLRTVKKALVSLVN